MQAYPIGASVPSQEIISGSEEPCSASQTPVQSCSAGHAGTLRVEVCESMFYNVRVAELGVAQGLRWCAARCGDEAEGAEQA
jgi:hypothetical protein